MRHLQAGRLLRTALAACERSKVGTGLGSNQHRFPASECRRIPFTGQVTGARDHDTLRMGRAQAAPEP